MMCRLCNIEKSENDFYASQKHICKDCIKKRAKENRAKKIEYYREYDRTCRNREKRILQHKLYKERLRKENPEKYDAIFHGVRKNYRKNNPEKAKANGVINDMLRCGIITRPEVCSSCGIRCKPQAHHPDYSKPKEVIWLCVKCHSKLHRELREQKRKEAEIA